MFNALKAQIGDRMAFVRQVKQVHQAPLAKELGITPLSLGKYERNDVGRRDIGVLSNFADYLGVNLNWLVKGYGDIFHVPMTLPQRYAYARLINEMTQEDAARKARCSRTVIAGCETEGPKDKRYIEKLARVYNVKPQFLMPDTAKSQQPSLPLRVSELREKTISDVKNNASFAIIPQYNDKLEPIGEFNIATHILPHNDLPATSLAVVDVTTLTMFANFILFSEQASNVLEDGVGYYGLINYNGERVCARVYKSQDEIRIAPVALDSDMERKTVSEKDFESYDVTLYGVALCEFSIRKFL